MSSLKEIYEGLTYASQNKITDLLNKLEAKIEKYSRNDNMLPEEEQILIQELKNINEIIIESGGQKIIFTDPEDLIKSADEFEKCVNWFKYKGEEER